MSFPTNQINDWVALMAEVFDGDGWVSRPPHGCKVFYTTDIYEIIILRTPTLWQASFALEDKHDPAIPRMLLEHLVTSTDDLAACLCWFWTEYQRALCRGDHPVGTPEALLLPPQPDGMVLIVDP